MREHSNKKTFEVSYYRRILYLAQWSACVLFFERIWPRLFPVFGLVSVFLLAVLFDLFRHLNGNAHLLILGGCGLALLILLIKVFLDFPWPKQSQALGRIEKDNDLNHQPLVSLLDQPTSKLSKEQNAIWLTHQDRIARSLGRLKWPRPKVSIGKQDPYSLRYMVVLLLIIGVFGARHDLGGRFYSAFVPQVSGFGQSNWNVQLWATPPSYTGLAADYYELDLTQDAEVQPLSLMQHSDLLLRLQGKAGREDLRLQIGSFSDKFNHLGGGSYAIESQISQGDFITLYRGKKVLYSWPVTLRFDQPPSVAIKNRPRQGKRGSLTFHYEAEDDFGVTEVKMHMRLLGAETDEKIELVKSSQEKKVKGQFKADLTAHPWAGKTVTLSAIATDNASQVSRSGVIEFDLPTRSFKHPVARLLSDLRHDLYETAEGVQNGVADQLAALLMTPASFSDQVAVYFSLVVAKDRLLSPLSAQDISEVQAILWETAVYLDEGSAGTLRDQLEYLSDRLSDLMNGSDDQGAMEVLFEEMTKSLDHFLQQMASQAGDLAGFEGELSSQDVDIMGRDQLLNMINQARELMRQGNMEAAQAVMQQFQDILQRMAAQQQIDPKEAAKVKEILDNLKQIKTRQQDLLDQTFTRSRNSKDKGLENTKKAIEEAKDQTDLRDALEAQMQAMRDLKVKVAEDLNRAVRNMQRSIDALETGLDEHSVQAQMQALQNLEDGLKDATEAMAQKMGMPTLGKALPGFDPMGRGRALGSPAGGGTMIPTERDIHQTREILQELYRRAGQKNRPEQELQYIDRLLDRF
jgi:uncharacterized protein (TIGR02302 family)